MAKKEKAFTEFSSLTIISVSAWLENRAKQSPMFKNRDFYVIGNGVDTSIYKPVNTATLRKKLGLKNQKVILHITPSFKSNVKGGEHVVEVAKRLQKENVIFIIVGYDGFKEKLPSNVITFSHTSSQEELAEFYSLANITLLTSKLETFSMVCAESLSCGTPIVGYKSGAPEQIAISEYSEFVENGDQDALVIKVREWLDKEIDFKAVLEKVNNKYSTKTMFKEYIRIYEEVNKD